MWQLEGSFDEKLSILEIQSLILLGFLISVIEFRDSTMSFALFYFLVGAFRRKTQTIVVTFFLRPTN